MSIVNKIKWKLSALYYRKLYSPKINFNGSEDFCKSVVTYNKTKGVTVVSAEEFNTPNNSGISLVAIANETYFPLLKAMAESLAYHEPIYDVTVVDFGLSDTSLAELKAMPNTTVIDYKAPFKIRADKAKHVLAEIFKLKQETIINISNYGKHRIKIYADSACVFLSPLTVLKNFVNKYGYFAGMTQTRTYEWGWHVPEIVNYWQAHFPQIQNPDYFGIEAGFMMFDMNHKLSKIVIDKLNYLLTNYEYLATAIFPFDQVMAGIAINELLDEHDDFYVNLHPNARVANVQDRKEDIEKNTLWRKGDGKAPLFGYCYHNNSNKPGVPPRRFREVELDYKSVPPALSKSS